MITYQTYVCPERRREFYYNPASDTVTWHAPHVALTNDNDDYDDNLDKEDELRLDPALDLFPEQEEEWKRPIDESLVLAESRRKRLGLTLLVAVTVLSTLFTVGSGILGTLQDDNHQNPAEPVARLIPPPKETPSSATVPVDQTSIPVARKPDDDTKPMGSPQLQPPLETVEPLSAPHEQEEAIVESSLSQSQSSSMAGLYECIPERLWEHDVVLPVELTRSLALLQEDFDTTAWTQTILARIESELAATSVREFDHNNNDNDDNNKEPLSLLSQDALCNVLPWAKRWWSQCKDSTPLHSSERLTDDLELLE